jgi:hypothetical protein
MRLVHIGLSELDQRGGDPISPLAVLSGPEYASLSKQGGVGSRTKGSGSRTRETRVSERQPVVRLFNGAVYVREALGTRAQDQVLGSE